MYGSDYLNNEASIPSSKKTMTTTSGRHERKVVVKIFDDGENCDEVTESARTVSTVTSQIKEGGLVDFLINAELTGAEAFNDEMKQAHEIRKRKMAKICFYS